MHGLALTVDRHLCQVRFVRWRKNHRKARINKKWHKKYGYESACKNDAAYRVGDSLISCPCVIAKLKAEMGKTAFYSSMPIPKPPAYFLNGVV